MVLLLEAVENELVAKDQDEHTQQVKPDKDQVCLRLHLEVLVAWVIGLGDVEVAEEGDCEVAGPAGVRGQEVISPRLAIGALEELYHDEELHDCKHTQEHEDPREAVQHLELELDSRGDILEVGDVLAAALAAAIQLVVVELLVQVVGLGGFLLGVVLLVLHPGLQLGLLAGVGGVVGGELTFVVEHVGEALLFQLGVRTD